MSTSHPKILLSQEQLLAVDNFKNLTVKAGAGSGKTFTLIKKYIKLLSLKITVDDTVNFLPAKKILTLTFTEKAAEEMKNRIYKELGKIQSISFEDFLIEYNFTNITDDQEFSDFKNHLLRIKNNFNSVYISTIHSFCGSLLKEFPIYAGINPDFEILTEYEADELIKQSFDETLESENLNPENLFECFSIFKLKQVLRMFINKKFEFFKFRNNFKSMSMTEYLNILEKFQENSFPGLKKNLIDYIEILKPVIVNNENNVSGRELTLFNLIEKLTVMDFSGINNYKKFYNKLKSLIDEFEQELTLLKRISLKDSDGNSYTLTKIYNSIDELGILNRLKPLDIDKTAFALIQEMVDFFEISLLKYDSSKEKLNKYDFSDLLINVRKLLYENKDKSFINILKNKFYYVMVDEYQDTNFLQYDIISFLCSNLNSELEPEKLFVVGDDKQAIYGFRDGDIRLFKKTINEIGSQELSAENLDGNLVKFETNRRSVPELIDFFNTFFSYLLIEENEYEAAHQVMKSFRKNHDIEIFNPEDFFILPDNSSKNKTNHLNNSVEILLNKYNEVDYSEVSARKKEYDEAYMIASFIKKIKNNELPVYKHIYEKFVKNEPALGILFRRYTKMQDFEYIFNLNNLDYVIHKGKGFYRSEEIFDVYNFLKFVNDTRNEINLIGILKKGFFFIDITTIFKLKNRDKNFKNNLWDIIKDLPEDCCEFLSEQEIIKIKNAVDIINGILKVKDSLRIAELIRKIIFDTKYVSVMLVDNKICLANIEKLSNIAREFESSRVAGLNEFVYFLSNKIDYDSDEGSASLTIGQNNTIQIMSYHASKGLEFPLVILPDLDYEFQFDKNFIFDNIKIPGSAQYMNLFGFKLPDKNREYESTDTVAMDIIKNESKIKNYAEEKRLFYVACTRAEDNLVFVLSLKEKDWEEYKKENIEFKVKARKYSDWLLKILKPSTVDCPGCKIALNSICYRHDINDEYICDLQNQNQNVKKQDIIIFLEKMKDISLSKKYQNKNLQNIKKIDSVKQVIISVTDILLFLKDKKKFIEKYKNSGKLNNDILDSLETEEFQEIENFEKDYFAYELDELDELAELDSSDKYVVEQNNDYYNEYLITLPGIIFHQLMEEKLFELFMKKNFKDIIKEKVLNYIFITRKRDIRTVSKETAEKQIESICEKILRNVNNFIKSEYYTLFCNDKNRLVSEFKIEFDYKQLKIIGFIDSLLFTSFPANKKFIFDYKTNSSKSFTNLTKDSIVKKNKYDYQINIYYYILKKIIPSYNFDEIILLFTDFNEPEYKVDVFKEKEIEKIFENILAVLTQNVTENYGLV